MENKPQTTADVEKIARETEKAILADEQITFSDFTPLEGQLQPYIAKALAQARAPLVEALELADESLAVIRNAHGTTLNPVEISQQAYRAHEAVRAALTGTGEEETLAGRTGKINNKKETSANAR